jgi:hypothetical protein
MNELKQAPLTMQPLYSWRCSSSDYSKGVKYLACSKAYSNEIIFNSLCVIRELIID